MKILKVEFTNINSLAGSWIIDFESPDYKNVGMFCISGPTGSGKTSILDAICLALYGRTPRQERVNKTSNEIMTRGTGVCQAKVIFENHGVKYSACWSQHRARDCSHGNLQGYSWLLANESGGDAKSYANQTAIEEEISKLIGLDFEQFTKSMMLAQGRFNEFLKCGEKERAEILEKLTGDSLHRKIAKSVYMLYTKSCDDVKNVMSKMDDDVPMDDENRKILDENISTQKNAKEKQEKENNRLVSVCQWYDILHGFKKEKESAEKNLMKAKQEEKDFLPEKEHLEKARRAQEIDAIYSELKEKRKSLESFKDKLVEKSDELKEAKDSLEIVERKEKHAQEKFDKYKIEYEKNESLWHKVSQLDEQIKSAKKQLDDSDCLVEKAQKKVDEVMKKISSLNKRIEKSSAELLEIDKYIVKNETDARIDSIISLLKSKVNQWHTLLNRCKNLKNDASNAEKDLSNFDKSNEITRKQYDEIKKYLNDYDIDAELVSVLPKIEGFLNSIKGHNDESKRLQKEIDNGEKSLEELLIKLKKSSESLNDLKNKKDEIIKNDIPIIVAELRKRLVNGVECPVCGSKEHPACSCKEAVSGSVATLNDFAEKLRSLDKNIDNFHNNINKFESQKETIERTKKIDIDKLEKEKSSICSILASFNESLKPWSIIVSSGEERTILANLTKRSEVFEGKKIQYSKLADKLKNTDVKRYSLSNKFDSIQENLAMALENEKDILSELKSNLSVWFLNVKEDDIDKLLLELDNKNKKWKEKQEKQRDLKVTLQTDESNRKLLQDQLEIEKDYFVQCKKDYESKNQEYNSFVKIRKELFGDKRVENERKTVAKLRDDADIDLKKVIEIKMKKSKIVGGLESSIIEYGEAIADIEPIIISMEKDFVVKLQEKGFDNENSFLTARLDEKVRKNLSTREKNISDSLVSAQTSLNDINLRLKNHIAKRDFVDAEDIAKQELEQGRVHLNKLSSEYNELLLQQRNDDKCRERYAIFQKTLEKLKEKQHRWEQMQLWFVADKRLDNGSGDAFVKFIQVITLRNLLSIANVHLREIWPRYELVATNDSLEIQLIDHDNSDEVHPVTNISGGEGFLASLSLALAISTLASENVSIDSMFLDEGFGTLDNKILQETVVSLQKLQQERGKMLGIITHVDLLKDELPVRIDVIPRGSGRSELKGAGVSSRA